MGRALDTDEAAEVIARQEFECPGNLASVAASREQVMQFVCQHCPDEAEQIDILVALQEALANAALHGCGDNAAKTIRCAVGVSPPDITISSAIQGQDSTSHWQILIISPPLLRAMDAAFA